MPHLFPSGYAPDLKHFLALTDFRLILNTAQKKKNQEQTWIFGKKNLIEDQFLTWLLTSCSTTFINYYKCDAMLCDIRCDRHTKIDLALIQYKFVHILYITNKREVQWLCQYLFGVLDEQKKTLKTNFVDHWYLYTSKWASIEKL